MPFQKGNPGRKKGAKGRRTLLVEEMASRHKLDPFEVLLMFANGDWKGLGYDSEVYVKEDAKGSTSIGYVISPETRMHAAKDAARYLYTPKQAVDVKADMTIKVVVEDYTKE